MLLKKRKVLTQLRHWKKQKQLLTRVVPVRKKLFLQQQQQQQKFPRNRSVLTSQRRCFSGAVTMRTVPAEFRNKSVSGRCEFQLVLKFFLQGEKLVLKFVVTPEVEMSTVKVLKLVF
jgi:hypothetical protein